MCSAKRFGAALLVVIMACCMLASCSTAKRTLSSGAGVSPASEDDSDWEMLESGAVVMENERIRFALDVETTHFTVTDRISQKVYESVPSGAVAATPGEMEWRAQSEITLKYYDAQSNEFLMYSTPDSVSGMKYTVRRDGNRVRVAYTLGASEGERFAPLVFKKDSFEKDILEKLESASKIRRIQRYYTLYSSSQADEKYTEMAARYPALKTQDLYILDDTLADIQLDEISGYMDEAGYTREAYTAVLNELGIEEEETALPPGFGVTVEYSLTADGFAAAILADRLVENSPDYKLQQIDFLEYFASCGEDAEGEYLVPDGSGALIEINDPMQENYQQAFFGNDYSIQSESKTQLVKNAVLPVFGMMQGRDAILGIVESAAGMASLHVKTMGSSSPQNVAYTSFIIRAMDVTTIGELRNIPSFNLYNKHLLRENPALRFVLLSTEEGDAIGYGDLAARYRSYLIDQGVLKDRLSKNEAAPLYVDYLCALTDPSQFLGVPYDRRVVLSRLEEIAGVQSRLQKIGVANTVIRLNGYGKDGLAHGANSAFELYGGVGSKKELLGLLEQQVQSGGALFLDADFQFVYKDRLGDDFSRKGDTAQFLNRSMVRIGDYDRVTRDYGNLLSRYYVSPASWMRLASGYADSLQKTLGTDILPGISYASAGLYLGGDYSVKRDIDRAMAIDYMEEVLAEMSGRFRLMSDHGNAYTLPYVRHLVNMPMGSSGFGTEKEEIPFYQMVIHGYLDYAGTPYNLSADGETGFLRSVEYGANLYFSWITGKNSLLSGTDYAVKFYSLNVDDSFASAENLYKRAAPFLNSVRGALMTGHEQVEKDVFRTSFDNGVSVVVNYSDDTVQVDGTDVGARDFRVIY